MKYYLKRIGILAAVYIIAVILISLLTGNKDDKASASMDTPSLPRLSFACQGYVINPLSGYLGKIDPDSIHGEIVPVDASGMVTLYVTTYDQPIDSLSYQMHRMGSDHILAKGKIKVKKDKDQQLTAYRLELADAFAKLGKDNQAVMELTAKVDGKKVSYFTRLVQPDPTSTKACLDFAVNVHEQTMDPQEGDTLESMIEPADLENQTLDYVTIQSDYEYITFLGLKPKMVGNTTWFIHEANSVSTSLTMRYHLMLEGLEDNDTIYTVEEFYRIRGNGKQMYLLDFQRRMSHELEDMDTLLDELGVNLGVANIDDQFRTDSKGQNIAFTMGDTVYTYNKKKNALVRVFGFEDDKTRSFAPDVNKRDIKILKVTDRDDVIFTVAGYMPRGDHEGRVGLSLFQYNYAKNYVGEILFVPSQLGYEVARDQLDNCLCYGGEDANYYLVADEVLYRLRVGAGNSASKRTVEEGMTEDRYAIAEDAARIAYLNENGVIIVRDLQNNKKYKVKPDGGETIQPIGFIGGDLVYGCRRESDAGQMPDGSAVTPYYKVIVCNRDDEEILTYKKSGVYMRDARVEDDTVTLERVQNTENSYVDIADDYIQNNKVAKAGNVKQEYLTGEDGVDRLHVTYEDEVAEKTPRLLTPKQSFEAGDIKVALHKKGYKDRFYVFGHGKAAGGHDKAGEAISAADKLSGVVAEGMQNLFWERGNRDLLYVIKSVKAFQMAEGETEEQACLNYMFSFRGTDKVLDLTGCSAEQTLYLINRDKPVVMVGKNGSALLMYGYVNEEVRCVNPKDGKRVTRTTEQLDHMARAYLTTDERDKE